MLDVRRRVRRALTQLIGRRAVAVLAAAGTIVLGAMTPAFAATPSPKPTSPAENSLTKAQMEALAPKTALHTEFIVNTNKLGQVTGAKATKESKDPNFNLQTYGNALQTFIRTDDGKAVPGVYKLTYDYDPKTRRIRRDVALVHEGGVDENAEGAALVMMDAAKKEAAAAAAAAKAKQHPSPAPKASEH